MDLRLELREFQADSECSFLHRAARLPTSVAHKIVGLGHLRCGGPPQAASRSICVQQFL